MTPSPFRTNPSTIARYFFHDCERFLYYSSAGPEQRRKEDIPRREFDHSPLMGAILASGYQWEEEVVTRLLAGRVVVGAGSGALHTRRLAPAETLRRLRSTPAGKYLYQATLEPPPPFYEKYGIDPDVVSISDNHPDLIAILPDGADRRLRVVDVKRGEAMRLAHRIQVALYALELQALLDATGITDAHVDLEQGAVWLGQQPEPTPFDLAPILPHLERFLRRDLVRILSQTAEEARWHVYARCEWCEFFEHCRAEMRDWNDLSRLEQLTTQGKRHLRDDAGVETLTELGTFLRGRDADDVLDRCASLAGQRHALSVRVAALETNTPQLLGAASPDLPRGENVAVFLTLHQEPLGKTTYLAGVLVAAREDVRRAVFAPELFARLSGETGKPQPCIWLAERPADAPAVRHGLVSLLFDVLEQVHRYNVAHTAWKDQLTLQVYVHAEDERDLLFRTLLEALQEPDLAEKAMTLLFHFQGPELLQTDQHPGSEVPYPVVVLHGAVSRLLALPIDVSYTLPETLEALGSTYAYPRRDYFHFPLGIGLRAEAIHAAWYDGKVDVLDELRRQGRHHLFAVQALLRAVREQAASCLVAWPPRFKLPTGAGIRDRVLSRLAFFARYESLVNCLAVREGRCEARPTQVLLGQVLELRARDAETMEVSGPMLIEPEAGGFPGWLLVRDTPEGRRAQVEYADYWYRNKYHGGPDSPHRAVAGVTEVRAEAGGDVVLHLTYPRPFRGEPPAAGEPFLLYPRFTDFTTDGIVRFLEKLDHEKDCWFVDLVRDPERAAVARALPDDVESHAAGAEASLGLTPSQREAYRAIRGRCATAVWGPPGTGKTHFLSAMILALAAAHARAGRPFRVLVTAYTHAAIENLLAKIAQHQANLTDAACTVRLGKAKYWQSTAAAVETVAEDETTAWLAQHEHAVLGATVYSCLKEAEYLSGFDLVVIDEASQVRVPEAAVPIHLMAATGRLVLAGDHLQLPPIVAGIYPEAPPGEPLLHRSIFEAVCGHDRNDGKPVPGSLVRILLENFRMNDVLTSVAATLLYGPGYCCVDEATARRRLPYRGGDDVDEMVQACLDPDHPLVVVVLEGIRAARANPVEADLVAQLVTALRAGLRDSRGRRYADDAEFFRRGVFVVSPHRAQIRAIQRELAQLRRWTAPPRVDTVDKMQGQEADAVIVSYGVADPEFALHEAEFIYGLNRLNVALTRARTKSIVCLPRPLLESTPQVLDRDVAAAGLAFMRRLVEVAESAGDVLSFEGDEVEAQVMRLARPLGRAATLSRRG